MELRPVDIPVMNRRGEPVPILCPPGYVLRHVAHEMVRVNKVEARIRLLPEDLPVDDLDVRPPHVRHGQGRRPFEREAPHFPADPSEPRLSPLLALAPEQLHSHADAEEGDARRNAPLEQGHDATLAELAHAMIEVPDAGEDESARRLDDVRANRRRHIGAHPLEHVGDRPEVADAVIDDDDHAAPSRSRASTVAPYRSWRLTRASDAKRRT